LALVFALVLALGGPDTDVDPAVEGADPGVGVRLLKME